MFDYDEMLSMSGDTAVYLLYAHARFVSIVRKSGKDPRQLLLCAAHVHVARSSWAGHADPQKSPGGRAWASPAAPVKMTVA